MWYGCGTTAESNVADYECRSECTNVDTPTESRAGKRGDHHVPGRSRTASTASDESDELEELELDELDELESDLPAE